MKLTETQIERLSNYEEYFNTAIHGNWSRYPGREALEMMHEILEEVTGTRRHLNCNCQSCVLALLQDIGRIYYRDKVVDIQDADATMVPKVAVKTKGRPKKAKDVV